MKRYLLIAAVVVLAYLVYQGVLWYARRRPEAEDAERTASMAPLAAALAGLLALVIGLFMLEMGAGTPEGDYKPAQLIDGKIQPGNFENTNFENTNFENTPSE